MTNVSLLLSGAKAPGQNAARLSKWFPIKPLVYTATAYHTSTTGPPVCGKKSQQIPWDLIYQSICC